mgnify:CR=1 FL=1
MCDCIEISKTIEGYENYKISSKGRVYSKHKKRVMKNQIHKLGYHQILLSKNGKKKIFLVHRLVGLHFIPNPENKPQIDHKDGNKINNCICNLRWSTRSENQLNIPLQKNNTSGHKHISWNKRKGKWRFRIQIDEKLKQLGSFDHIELAIDFRDFYYEFILEKDLLEYRI